MQGTLAPEGNEEEGINIPTRKRILNLQWFVSPCRSLTTLLLSDQKITPDFQLTLISR